MIRIIAQLWSVIYDFELLLDLSEINVPDKLQKIILLFIAIKT